MPKPPRSGHPESTERVAYRPRATDSCRVARKRRRPQSSLPCDTRGTHDSRRQHLQAPQDRGKPHARMHVRINTLAASQPTARGRPSTSAKRGCTQFGARASWCAVDTAPTGATRWAPRSEATSPTGQLIGVRDERGVVRRADAARRSSLQQEIIVPAQCDGNNARVIERSRLPDIDPTRSTGDSTTVAHCVQEGTPASHSAHDSQLGDGALACTRRRTGKVVHTHAPRCIAMSPNGPATDVSVASLMS